MQAIQTKNLEVGYSNQAFLHDVNLEIDHGDFVMFTGGNGSGKSTLLKTLLGLVPPVAGGVTMFDQPLSRDNIARHISYVPQTSKIERDFPISVEEVINLECRNVAHKHESSSKHLQGFAAEHLLKRKLDQLSGGEFQKVLIARALVSNLDVIMLDEPTNNLDRKSAEKLLGLLADLNRAGKTIVVITHDISEFQGISLPVKTYHIEERRVVLQ